MKKLDKLILSSFIGPFILTFIVVVFILLNQHMLRYFDDIIGKNLGFEVVGSLFFYFSIFMMPMAIPLAILLSSLITFSNFGEYSELTAMKSLGVSMPRSILPLFIVILFITVFAFYVNNYFVPRAALEAYSLLYDIKQKKPALDLREGIFYNAIPGISIKADKKLPDGQTLEDIILYDHRKEAGDKNVIIAKSGKIYTIMDGHYLKLDIFDGYSYSEDMIEKETGQGNNPVRTLSKAKFLKTEIVFDLSSFGLTRTSKNWFRGHRIMRNMSELEIDVDSLTRKIFDQRLNAFARMKAEFVARVPVLDSVAMPSYLASYKQKRDSLFLLSEQGNGIASQGSKSITGILPALPSASRGKQPPSLSLFTDYVAFLQRNIDKNEIVTSLNWFRLLKDKLLDYTEPIVHNERDLKVFKVQWHKILASSVACLGMFFIGAPLGSIIRKGGLGVPVIISIFFFVAFYIFTIMGEKWAKQGVLPVSLGTWTANIVLLVVGAFFLSRAKADTRLLDTDFYSVMWDKIKKGFRPRREKV